MILQTDTRHIPLRDGCVQCVVTSPPYWGLRDYGTARWEGGDEDCPHAVPATGSTQNKGNNGKIGTPFRDKCGKCGARRIDRQIGLELSPADYIAALVEVFRELWRVLRDDGTVWLNLGDSYAANAATSQGKVGFESYRGSDTPTLNREYQGRNAYRGNGIKAKDLMGMPWRVAFALQADGWYLRSDIIWAKPNPMPESVTDRPTRSHEYLFLLSKSERYFYDADAIKEQGSPYTAWCSDVGKPNKAALMNPEMNHNGTGKTGLHNNDKYRDIGRNKRDVWTVVAEPFPEAHFATFPKSLIRPCILAGSRVGDWVLDPFLGSGTTIEVCTEEGRRGIGLELNRAYIEIARWRTAQMGFIFGTGD